MMTFNEPYEKPSDPQLIREDFINLADMSDYRDLIKALASQLSTDQLAVFIDDRLMGRV